MNKRVLTNVLNCRIYDICANLSHHSSALLSIILSDALSMKPILSSKSGVHTSIIWVNSKCCTVLS